MRGASYSHQSYYSQPYQFYYTATGRYCAYDANSGTHLIHNLTDNRWYPYYSGIVPSSQQQPQQQPYPYNTANTYQYTHFEHKPHGTPKTGGVRNKYPDDDYFKTRERHRDSSSRTHRGEFLYSAADAEAAERSLIEDSNIEMEPLFEDEGVDVRMEERIERSRRASNERQRQRSRSGPERRMEGDTRRSSPYNREPSRAQINLDQNKNKVHHACQCQHTRAHTKHGHGPHFGSNHAGVGYEGSEHDSGYMEDLDPPPEPRRNMPGVARWLDNTPSEFSEDDIGHPFHVQHDGTRHSPEQSSRFAHSRRAGRASISDPRLDKAHRGKYPAEPPYHRESYATQRKQQQYKATDRLPSRKDDHYRSPPNKTLHRQDSGIDMSDAMTDDVDLEIDIHMDDVSVVEDVGIYPGPGCFPRGSPHPAYVNPRRSTQPKSSRKTEAEFDCYYTIPPCPNLPPLQEPAIGTMDMIYLSGTQELSAPQFLRDPPVSPTFRQSDSAYTASKAATPLYHASPSMLPRAPSPPLSPPPMRRSGLGVPVADYERRYTGRRW